MTQSLKTEPRITRENNVGYILYKVHVRKWSVVEDKHIKMKPKFMYFVFELDGECKFTKTKQYSDGRNMFLAATLVGRRGDSVHGVTNNRP